MTLHPPLPLSPLDHYIVCSGLVSIGVECWNYPTLPIANHNLTTWWANIWVTVTRWSDNTSSQSQTAQSIVQKTKPRDEVLTFIHILFPKSLWKVGWEFFLFNASTLLSLNTSSIISHILSFHDFSGTHKGKCPLESIPTKMNGNIFKV